MKQKKRIDFRWLMLCYKRICKSSSSFFLLKNEMCTAFVCRYYYDILVVYFLTFSFIQFFHSFLLLLLPGCLLAISYSLILFMNLYTVFVSCTTSLDAPNTQMLLFIALALLFCCCPPLAFSKCLQRKLKWWCDFAWLNMNMTFSTAKRICNTYFLVVHSNAMTWNFFDCNSHSMVVLLFETWSTRWMWEIGSAEVERRNWARRS